MEMNCLERLSEIVPPAVDPLNPDWRDVHIYTHMMADSPTIQLVIYGVYRDRPYTSSFEISLEILNLIQNGNPKESLDACSALVDRAWKKLREAAEQDGNDNRTDEMQK